MFKNILVPTDGSRLSLKGVRSGVKLAKALGAKVAGVYVMLPYQPATYGEVGPYFGDALSREVYEKAARKNAQKALQAVEREARAAGVRCSTWTVVAPIPWQGIVKAARTRKCDAIAMASHGYGSLGGLILGSETTRVLAHSKIPVLVSR